MSDFERHTAGREARRTVPGRTWRPDEERSQDMLRRYLQAVATVSHAAGQQGEPAPTSPPGRTGPARHPAVPRVRDIMSTPAVSLPGDTPFLEIARVLSHEHVGAVPVVDAEGAVTGMVSESDLLAKAAVEANRQGPVGRLRDRRLYGKSRGETAATLMTAPAVTVSPETSVAEAAWLAARSRLRRLPVTDHRGRLVGVVTRGVLLAALIRDDEEIREEIRTRILRHELRLDPDAFELTVVNGVVTVRGRMPQDTVPDFLEAVSAIDDVVEVDDHLIRT